MCVYVCVCVCVLIGMVDLRSCIAVVASDDKIKGYKYVMNIVMSSFRVHHLAATTKEEMDEWILALNEFVFSKTKVRGIKK